MITQTVSDVSNGPKCALYSSTSYKGSGQTSFSLSIGTPTYVFHTAFNGGSDYYCAAVGSLYSSTYATNMNGTFYVWNTYGMTAITASSYTIRGSSTATTTTITIPAITGYYNGTTLVYAYASPFYFAAIQL